MHLRCRILGYRYILIHDSGRSTQYHDIVSFVDDINIQHLKSFIEYEISLHAFEIIIIFIVTIYEQKPTFIII